MTNLGIELIPRIWVDTLNANLRRQMLLGWDDMVQDMEEYRQRLTEQERAEQEAESYWIALYDNQIVYEEEEDW